jgi:two-component system, OmpR family, response regulator
MMTRILIVEDHSAVQEVIAEFLRDEGHEVFCAATADAARRLLAAEPIDLMLADCVLRGEQGERLGLHASRLGVAVILMTGDAGRLNAVERGTLPVLPKPFSLSQLDDLVTGALLSRERHLGVRPIRFAGAG